MEKIFFDNDRDIFLCFRERDGKIIEVNNIAFNVYGYTREELLSLKIDALFSSGEMFLLEPHIHKAVGSAFYFEATHQRKDGSIFPVEMNIQVANIGEEKLFLCIVLEINELTKAREALEKLSRQSELILSSTGEGILSLDLEGKINSVNPVAAKMLGYKIDELVNQPSHAIWNHPGAEGRSYLQKKESPIYAVCQDGFIHIADDEVFWRKNGTSFPVQYLSTPIRGQRNELIGVVVVFKDITDRKQAVEILKASEANCRTIFNAADDATFIYDIESGNILDVNQKMCEMYGYTLEEVRQLNINELCVGESPCDKEHAVQFIEKAVEGEPQIFEQLSKDKTGKLFWVEVNLKRIFINGYERLLAVIRDITERKKVEQTLNESKDFFEKVVNSANALIVGLDQYGKIVLFNDYCEEVTGWKREKAEGKHWITNFVPAWQWSQVGLVSKSFIKDNDRKEYENSILTKTGEERIITWSNTVWRDAADNISLVIGTGIDITERKQAEKKLLRLSFLDGLTGIANRRYFDEYLEREMQRAVRDAKPLSLIMCDIDYFKAYNDTYGHHGGDDCLKKIAGALRSVLKRPGDFVARYGGEEFAIVLSNTDADGAVFVAEILWSRVEDLGIEHAGSLIGKYVTISLGVATMYPKAGSSSETLINASDQALYQAKQEGRNRVKLVLPR